jgi:hypothetical protein
MPALDTMEEFTLKKNTIVALALSALLVLSLFACDADPAQSPPPDPTEPPPTDLLSGDLPDILASVLDDANARLEGDDKFVGSFEDPVTADNCNGILGLTPEEFERYVAEAYVSTAAISTFAHQVALIRCKDFAAAAEVMRLVAAGFDLTKWICAFPEECFVMDSGSYVLLVATKAKGAEALRTSFEVAARGYVGDANVFYVFADSGDGFGGGGFDGNDYGGGGDFSDWGGGGFEIVG